MKRKSPGAQFYLILLLAALLTLVYQPLNKLNDRIFNSSSTRGSNNWIVSSNTESESALLLFIFSKAESEKEDPNHRTRYSLSLVTSGERSIAISFLPCFVITHFGVISNVIQPSWHLIDMPPPFTPLQTV